MAYTFVQKYRRLGSQPLDRTPRIQMRPRQSYLRLAITGAVLGSISTFMNYGAGGFLILAIAVGSLAVITRWKTSTIPATLICATAVCATFYTVGFRMISDPLSGQTLMMFLALIGIPTLIAIMASGFKPSCNKKNDEQAAP
jgi:hypothetical protein